MITYLYNNVEKAETDNNESVMIKLGGVTLQVLNKLPAGCWNTDDKLHHWL